MTLVERMLRDLEKKMSHASRTRACSGSSFALAIRHEVENARAMRRVSARTEADKHL